MQLAVDAVDAAVAVAIALAVVLQFVIIAVHVDLAFHKSFNCYRIRWQTPYKREIDNLQRQQLQLHNYSDYSGLINRMRWKSRGL